jgi:small subunit ribosomal protein S16
MIKIRLQRHGARHAPFYRMVVAPAQSRRDGRFIEVLGTYNPQSSSRDRELDLKMDRVDHWLEVGAQPTDTANSLIRQGRLSPEEWLKRTESKAKAKAARAAKKKNPAPVVEEAPAEAPAEEAAEEPKAEEAPAPEAKEEAPAEEKAPEPEAKEEAPKAEAEEVKEEKAEESAEEAKPEPEAKAEDKAEEKEGEES